MTHKVYWPVAVPTTVWSERWMWNSFMQNQLFYSPLFNVIKVLFPQFHPSPVSSGSQQSSKTSPPAPTLLSSFTTARSKQTSSKSRSFWNRRWLRPGTVVNQTVDKEHCGGLFLDTGLTPRPLLSPVFGAGILISAHWTKSPLTWEPTFLQSSLRSSRTVQIMPVSLGGCFYHLQQWHHWYTVALFCSYLVAYSFFLCHEFHESRPQEVSSWCQQQINQNIRKIKQRKHFLIFPIIQFRRKICCGSLRGWTTTWTLLFPRRLTTTPLKPSVSPKGSSWTATASL